MNRLCIVLSAFLFSFHPLAAFWDMPFWDIPFGGTAGLAYDFFRSVPDGDWDGNIGGVWDLNLGTKFETCCEAFSPGVQIGGSYGVYDWSGRGSNVNGNPREVQQQGFLTVGLSLETRHCTGFNAAVAYDWMMNKNFGVFALPCGLSQFRFQGGYLFYGNEFGVLGTVDTHTCHRHVEGFDVNFRAISQVSLYWQRYYDNCARTIIWAGVPYKKSLLYSKGRAGKYVLGCQFDVPLACRFFVTGHAMYMQGHSARVPFQTRTNAANICLGIYYHFAGPNGDTTPYLPIGNNSNFIVDTSVTY